MSNFWIKSLTCSPGKISSTLFFSIFSPRSPTFSLPSLTRASAILGLILTISSASSGLMSNFSIEGIFTISWVLFTKSGFTFFFKSSVSISRISCIFKRVSPSGFLWLLSIRDKKAGVIPRSAAKSLALICFSCLLDLIIGPYS